MGQYCWAYHSWEYRQMMTPWPRKRDVHMIMFQMGPFLWSCKMKLNITAGKMKMKVYWTNKAMLQYFVGLSAFSSKHLVKILTSKTHEEAEKYGIEETEADCQNILVDHCWYCEHKQHGRWFTALLRHLEWTQQMEEKCNKWSVNAAVTFIIVLFIFCK